MKVCCNLEYSVANLQEAKTKQNQTNKKKHLKDFWEDDIRRTFCWFFNPQKASANAVKWEVSTGTILDVVITIWDFRENPKEAVFSFQYFSVFLAIFQLSSSTFFGVVHR